MKAILYFLFADVEDAVIPVLAGLTINTLTKIARAISGGSSRFALHVILVVIEGGPHGVAWTHAGKVNHELLDFLGQGARSSRAA